MPPPAAFGLSGMASKLPSGFRLPDLSGETIGVQAGDQIIHVHKDLISATSEFFKNATKPEWATEGKPVDLSDEQPIFFKKYCQWLYTRIVPSRDKTANNSNTFMFLARMYVLGEKIIDYAFQNAIIDAMIANHTSAKPSQKVPGLKVPGWKTIDIIYKGTTERAPARRLFVDLWVFNMLPTWETLDTLKEVRYKPFADDLLRALIEKRGIPDRAMARPWISEPDSYHSKIIVLKTGMSAKKNETAAVEPASQDEMDISEN